MAIIIGLISKSSSGQIIKLMDRTRFKGARVDLEASIYQRFDMGSYTSYCRVGEFLKNSNRRLSYMLKLAL